MSIKQRLSYLYHKNVGHEGQIRERLDKTGSTTRWLGLASLLLVLPIGGCPDGKVAVCGTCQTNVPRAGVVQPTLRVQANPLAKPRLAGVGTGLVVYEALKATLDRLQTLLDSATADIKAAGNSLEGNGHALLSDMDSTYKDMLDKTFQDINDTERQLWNSAVELEARATDAANALASQASEAAKVALWEGDIVAYNAVKGLPCTEQPGRVVYASSASDTNPLAINLGVDQPTVIIRGNFLSFTKISPQVDGQPANPTVSNASEVVLTLPSTTINKINSTGESIIPISVPVGSCQPILLQNKCNYVELTPQQVGILVRPQKKSSMTAVIQPIGDVPRLNKYLYQYRSDPGGDQHPEDCDIKQDVTQEFCLPQDDPKGRWVFPPEMKPFEPGYSSVNCNQGGDHQSTFGPPVVKGDHCLTIPGLLRGCGYTVVWPLKNCNGRAWLYYDYNIHYQTFSTTYLESQGFSHGLHPGDEIDFQYTKGLPDGVVGVRWTYTVVVTTDQGGTSQSISLTNDHQSSGKFETSFDQTSRRLHVTYRQ